MSNTLGKVRNALDVFRQDCCKIECDTLNAIGLLTEDSDVDVTYLCEQLDEFLQAISRINRHLHCALIMLLHNDEHAMDKLHETVLVAISVRTECELTKHKVKSSNDKFNEDESVMITLNAQLSKVCKKVINSLTSITELQNSLIDEGGEYENH